MSEIYDKLKGRLLVALNVVNESDRIVAWLDHWTKISDDIVIVNQSSTDDTIEKIKTYQADNPTIAKNILIFHIPHLGMCEPPYMAIQKMAASENKWLLKVDADEFMPPEMILQMIDECDKQKKDNGITTFLIARRNFINERNASMLFRSPQDPDGNDWHPRIIWGLSVGFGFNMHQYPHINGRFAYLDPEVYYINHMRTWDDTLKSNITRMKFASEQVKAIQRAWLERVAQFLGMTQEEYIAEVEKYE